MTFFNIEFPKNSKWVMKFGGHYTLSVIEGKHPNWFNRKMQELCFGVKWTKT